MKKYLFVLFLALSLTACGDKTDEVSTSDKQTVKIGGIFPLSGSQASMGEAAKAGMLKALADKNKDNLHYNYQLIFEDNQGKLSVMPTVTNKMIVQDNVDAIGTYASSFAQIMAPIADKHNILQWDYSWEDKNFKRFGKYAFVQGIATQDMVDAIYGWVKNSRENNIAIYAQDAGVIAIATQELENKLKLENIQYVINKFNPGERDFRLTITKNKENGFSKFLVISFPPEKEIVLKQMIEAGITKSNILGITLDMTKPNNLYEDMKTITYNQGTQKFIDNIVEEYNLSSTFGTAASYDFVNLVVDAYEHLYKENYKPTIEEVTTYIQSKKSYKCMSGECIVHDNGFIINKPIFRICKNNKWLNID